MKRAAAFNPQPLSTRERQMIELLAQLRLELSQQWESCMRAAPVDDELLPAQQQIEDALVAVNLALERATAGQYGICTSCGGHIDFERLLAHPTATTCWPCQESAEDKPRSAISH